jgi:fructose-bisphosphate aldolase class I
MLVPIVEPEVLMDGDHGLERCFEVTCETLSCTFEELDRQGVLLEGMILKPNMVLPGLACPVQVDACEVADATTTCLLRSVPAAVAGIAFLSGGQAGELASERLAAMHRQPVSRAARRPWPLTFSFGRALQEPALAIWAGDDANVPAARAALLHRAACNGAAVQGAYDRAMEAA